MNIPLKEMLSSIPGFFGIRLEEEPNFQVLKEEGSFQVRRYPELVVATTVVNGDRAFAMDEGFRRLAGYIFGGNQRQKTISMTTPVIQSPEESKTISMTTPVIQEKTNAGWTMMFVLPSEISLESAPIPNDERVKVEPMHQRTLATYRYNGNNNEEEQQKAAAELSAWVQKQNLKQIGEIFWAQYDQPVAVPYFKRNEAMVEVVSAH